LIGVGAQHRSRVSNRYGAELAGRGCRVLGTALNNDREIFIPALDVTPATGEESKRNKIQLSQYLAIFDEFLRTS